MAGAPIAVRLDGRTTVHWWGQDERDHDCIATRTRCLLTWTDEGACLQAARAAGWTFDDGQRGQAPHDALIDLDPAREWVARRCLWLDPVAGLHLWNWAWDVAHSTGQPWHVRGHTQQRCYDKLVAANIPFMVDLASYRPTWTPRQLQALRATLATALHVVRTGLQGRLPSG